MNFFSCCFYSFFSCCVLGVSASSGSIELWASMIIGLTVGVISSVVSWSVRKYQPLWTSTGMHDITYIHGVPGILGAVTGKTSQKLLLNRVGMNSIMFIYHIHMIIMANVEFI